MGAISGGNFKGLSPSITPFGKKKFSRIIESKVPKERILSISKMNL